MTDQQPTATWVIDHAARAAADYIDQGLLLPVGPISLAAMALRVAALSLESLLRDGHEIPAELERGAGVLMSGEGVTPVPVSNPLTVLACAVLSALSPDEQEDAWNDMVARAQHLIMDEAALDMAPASR